MNAVTYPAGAYGSRPGEGFAPLGASADFPPAARESLRALFCQFQWREASAGQHPACFATWPMEGGALVGRYVDAGMDDRHRPHTLRLEAIWCEGPPDAGQLAALLDDRAWAHAPATWTDGRSMLPQPPNPAVLDALTERPSDRLLVAPHRHFHAQGFDRVIAPDDPQEETVPTVRRRSTHRGTDPLDSSRSNANGKRKWAKQPWMSLGALILGLMAGYAWREDTLQDARQALVHAEEANAQQLRKERNLRDERDQFARELAQLKADEQHGREAGKHLRDVSARLVELSAKLTEVQAQLDQLLKREASSKPLVGP